MTFESQRDALTATDAERGKALLRVAADHFVQERDQYAAARRADGMSQRNRAAVDVDFLGILAKFLADRQRLGGKGLVGFDQVQLVQ